MDARTGFALVVALFVLIVLAAAVAGGLFVARHQSRIGLATSQGAPAFYAAESGLDAALARLDMVAIDSLVPGQTRALDSGRLMTGDYYSTWLTRLDDGGDGRVGYYLLESEGRATGPEGGRRRVARLLKSFEPPDVCCRGALLAGGEVRVVDGAAVDGRDRTPESWKSIPGLCLPSPPAEPGIVLDSLGSVVVNGGRLDGEPPVLSGAANVSEVERLMQELVPIANLRLAADTMLSVIEPALADGGRCERARASNWGAPAAPDHACFDYLPIIHARGDLQIETAGAGQGVLLVEGDLEVTGGFVFYGIAIVRGRLAVSGAGAGFLGGTHVLDRELFGTILAEGARILSSRCAVERALEGSELLIPHPLAQFSWLEILM